MIIRSQNKKSITTDLNLQIYEDDWSDKFGIMDSKGAELGLYSTEEKAIKVLDMIQSAYCRTEDVKSGAVQAQKYDSFCFNMLQDSEV